MAKGSGLKAFILIAVLAFIVFLLSKNGGGAKKSGYYAQVSQYPDQMQMQMQPMQMQVQAATPPPPPVMQSDDAQMLGGVSSGLLPKEPVNQEDFGSFSAESILSGQNFLDPRAQIGYPETVGGTLRNANLQLRSEPANPRDPVSIFNLSTIVPDTMRPEFEIGAI